MPKRQLTSEQIDDLLAAAQVGHLATIDPDGHPYVVPVHFVRLGQSLFIHGGTGGRKIDNLARDPKAGFEVTGGFALDLGEAPCAVSTAYQSVVIAGRARLVADEAQKLQVLDALIAKYAPVHAGRGYQAEALTATGIIALDIERLSGKFHP
jgi:nitroimidazol reductase NimA-like FMN-containing flavoprotein (pyridoxamine 5'-phosphate oxidase superfamily)